MRGITTIEKRRAKKRGVQFQREINLDLKVQEKIQETVIVARINQGRTFGDHHRTNGGKRCVMEKRKTRVTSVFSKPSRFSPFSFDPGGASKDKDYTVRLSKLCLNPLSTTIGVLVSFLLGTDPILELLFSDRIFAKIPKRMILVFDPGGSHMIGDYFAGVHHPPFLLVVRVLSCSVSVLSLPSFTSSLFVFSVFLAFVSLKFHRERRRDEEWWLGFVWIQTHDAFKHWTTGHLGLLPMLTGQAQNTLGKAKMKNPERCDPTRNQCEQNSNAQGRSAPSSASVECASSSSPLLNRGSCASCNVVTLWLSPPSEPPDRNATIDREGYAKSRSERAMDREKQKKKRAQVHREEKTHGKTGENVQKTSHSSFKFKVHAPGFVPRSYTPQPQVPNSNYFYPCFQILNGFVCNALNSVFGHSGFMESACQVFDESSLKDIVVGTALSNGYVGNDHPREALKCFVGYAMNNSMVIDLRRHLENLSAAGSKIASKCLRCTEWSLLDTLTWPVYVLQYLAVNGYTIGPEWKGFYDEVFYGEYYLLPVNRKETILQILCDDVLESKDAIDNNGDECCFCGMDGTLLCCDGCPATYHSRCIGVMKMYIPDGEWYCPECTINLIGPTISRGTLKGAEIIGSDLYGQIFMGTCDHFLVLNLNRGECCLKYYSQNDIPGVIRLLIASMQHRPLYVGICTAILQYWSIPESSLDHCVPNGTHVNSGNTKIDYNLSAASLPAVVEDELRAVSLGKAECRIFSCGGQQLVAQRCVVGSSWEATCQQRFFLVNLLYTCCNFLS